MGRITRASSNGCTTAYEYDSMRRKYSESEYSSHYSVFRGFFYEGISSYVSREITGQYNLLSYSFKSYEYDSEMRVSKVKESGKEIASYTYDANGNKKSETLGNGVVSTYTYNKANRITKLENKSGDITISSYEYSYFLDGSDSCKVRSENGIIERTEYEYDGLKRLTEESVKVGDNTADTYAYEYDDYGNRSKMTAAGSENYVTEYNYNNAQGNYTALLQKEIKTVQSENNALNNNSNVKQTVYTYDANGNQITKTADGKTETNTYDGLNQLIGFTDGETNASYKYNVSGLRIEKVVNGQRINHVWDGSKQIVADIVEGDTYNANCYVRGTNLAAKYKFVNGAKSEYTYYTQNAHGDVVNLTDADGEVTKKYTYDAFGVEKNISDSDANPFRYCGEYFDAETGTIYLRARYYNPITGRFISRDSVTGKIEDPLSLNLYTYCHNNPLFYVDPSGHIKCPKFIKSIGNWFEDRADDWVVGTQEIMEYHKEGMDMIEDYVSQKKCATSYNISASLMTSVWCFDGGISFVCDSKGNFAIQNYKGTGIGTGTPSVSAGLSKSKYYVDDYTYLEGYGATIGGSGSVGILDVGVDANFGMEVDEKGAFNNPRFIGATAGVGVALNSTVVGGGECHLKAGEAETIFHFNFFDWYDENIYEKVMSW